jgi:uncharacterized protein (TIGR03067 family)
MCPALLLAFALAAPALKDAPKKGGDLTGEWVVESVVYGGRPRAPQKDPLRYVFDADGTWTIYRGERKPPGNRAYRTEPDAEPPAITLKYDAAEQDGPESLGIYRLDGDTLTMCYNRPGVSKRPTEFASPEGSGTSLMVLKRARPKD